MTQEYKNLLLQDLCSRLPYGVKVQDEIGRINKLVIGNSDLVRLYYNDFSIYSEKQLSLPYLFPKSSMTEEQRKEYESLCIKETFERTDLYGIIFTKDYYYDTIESIDYLYKNHIDIRGLIENGLAIDASNLNIY